MATKDSGGGQQRASKKSEEVEEVQPDAPAETVAERHEKISEDVDALLDEIDDVLEENAEDFVRGYIQKGGQ